MSIWQGCLPDTDYFEMESSRGRSYGIWVTTPPGHDVSASSLPVVYVLDGNWAVGQTAPLIVTQADPMGAVLPYLQVSIGYAGEEAEHWARLRNRDLVPPGEPVGPEFLDAVEGAYAAGAMTREAADAYLAELQDSQADAFLDFIVSELHPRIERDYGTATSGHGLFGYSYGGLFSLYAWLSRTPLFDTIGAGSPGIATEKSQVLAMLPEGAGPTARLHVTLNEQELLGELPVYRVIGQNVAAFLHRQTGTSAVVTSAMLHETHVTGLTASFLSYLRICRAR